MTSVGSSLRRLEDPIATAANPLDTVEILSILSQFLTTADLLRSRAVSRAFLEMSSYRLNAPAVRWLSSVPVFSQGVELAHPSQLLAMSFDQVTEELYVVTRSDAETTLFIHDRQLQSYKFERLEGVDAAGPLASSSFAGPYFTVRRRGVEGSDSMTVDCRTKQPAMHLCTPCPFGVSPNGRIAVRAEPEALVVLDENGDEKCHCSTDGQLDAVWVSDRRVIGLGGSRQPTLYAFAIDQIITASAKPTNREEDRLWSISPIAESELPSDACRAVLDGDVWRGVLRDGTLLAWDTSSVEVAITSPVTCSGKVNPPVVTCCSDTRRLVKGRSHILGIEVLVPGKVLGLMVESSPPRHFDTSAQHWLVAASVDGTATRKVPLPASSGTPVVAFHPSYPVAVAAADTDPKHHSLIYEALGSGMGSVIDLGGLRDLRGSDFEEGGEFVDFMARVLEAAWGALVTSKSYAMASLVSHGLLWVLLLWTVSALVYNGWWLYLQDFFRLA